MDAMVAILEREPSKLTVGAGAQKIISKSLQKDPEDRYQTTSEFLADLEAAKETIDITVPAEQMASPPRLGKVVLLALLLVIASLIGIFFYRKQSGQSVVPPSPAVASIPSSLAYPNMDEAQRLVFIREQEQRISRMMGENPQELSDDALQAIKRHVDRYVARISSTSTAAGRDSLQVIHTRAQAHVPFITRVFAERKVPALIAIYLPMIESEYRPCEQSRFGSKGIFQFLPQTAQAYGVRVDEMCNVEKMAPAAANYVADRMAELGEDSESMTLVLVSYNRGTQFVQSSLRQLRGEQNYQRNFWTLFAHRDQLDENFRNETAGYVPAFFAAAIIGENPQRFGLSTPPLSTLAQR